MWMNECEITAAYLGGRDIVRIWQRRRWIAYSLLTVAVGVPTFFLLYAVKTVLGIDLFEGHLL